MCEKWSNRSSCWLLARQRSSTRVDHPPSSLNHVSKPQIGVQTLNPKASTECTDWTRCWERSRARKQQLNDLSTFLGRGPRLACQQTSQSTSPNLQDNLAQKKQLRPDSGLDLSHFHKKWSNSSSLGSGSLLACQQTSQSTSRAWRRAFSTSEARRWLRRRAGGCLRCRGRGLECCGHSGRGASGRWRRTRRCGPAQFLSHIMCLSTSFREPTPPQNLNLSFTITN